MRKLSLEWGRALSRVVLWPKSQVSLPVIPIVLTPDPGFYGQIRALRELSRSQRLVIAPRAAWQEKKGKKGGGGRAEDLRAQTMEEQVDPGVSIKQGTYPPVPATRCACALVLVQNSDKSPESLGKEPQLVHHRRHSHFRKESVPRHSHRLPVLPGTSVSQRRPGRAGSCSSDPHRGRLPGVFPSPQSQLHWPMQWAA